MPVIYIHGVKVRDPAHGMALGDSFRRWLNPKLSVDGNPFVYIPVFWGDAAARFRWNLQSRPKTAILGMGGTASASFAGLGSLREASTTTPLDFVLTPSAQAQSPVLGQPPRLHDKPIAPPLSTVPIERRPDFLADLYLTVYSRRIDRASAGVLDPIAAESRLAGLAAAAAATATEWDRLVVGEPNDAARAARLMSAVNAHLEHDALLAQGGFADWMTRADETLRRAAVWPGDAISAFFSELRPTVNEFVAYFLGDILAYINERGQSAPGTVPQRVLGALSQAHLHKKQTGEKIIVVTHSMGGQLFYDAITFFAQNDPTLAGIEIDHWISCGSQVSLFAELALFNGQPTDVAAPRRLNRPAAVKAWTNFYDRNDLVGFVMSPVFDGVTDTAYDIGYGLAFAHTGYLSRPSFFDAIAARI
jgi:hypothetical protein